MIFKVIVTSILTVSGLKANAISWDEARTAALDGNFTLKQAEFDIEKAEESISSGRAGYYPTLKASYGKTRDFETTSNMSSTRNRLAVTASQNIFSGLADSATVDTAESSKVAATAAKSAASVAQRAALRKEFDHALFYQEAESLAKKTAARRAENVRIVNLRYEGGRENKSSALKTQAAQLQAEADERFYRASLDISRSLVSQLTGRPIAPTESFQGSLDRVDSSRQDKALDHPRILQVLAQRDAASATVTSARSGWLPNLSADASAFRQGLDNKLEPENHYSVGLTLTVPLFNPSQSPRYRDATIELSKTDLRLAQIRSDLAIETRKSQIAVENAISRRDVALKVLEASQMQAEVYRQRYTLGMVSFQDWDTAEAEFIKAEKELLSARLDLANALSSLDEAHGRTLEDAGP